MSQGLTRSGALATAVARSCSLMGRGSIRALPGTGIAAAGLAGIAPSLTAHA
jgi:hypothetical protein